MQRYFEDWFEELKWIADEQGYEFEPTFAVEFEYWRGLFEQGLTPQQAWDK